MCKSDSLLAIALFGQMLLNSIGEKNMSKKCEGRGPPVSQ